MYLDFPFKGTTWSYKYLESWINSHPLVRNCNIGACCENWHLWAFKGNKYGGVGLPSRDTEVVLSVETEFEWSTALSFLPSPWDWNRLCPWEQPLSPRSGDGEVPGAPPELGCPVRHRWARPRAGSAVSVCPHLGPSPDPPHPLGRGPGSRVPLSRGCPGSLPLAPAVPGSAQAVSWGLRCPGRDAAAGTSWALWAAFSVVSADWNRCLYSLKLSRFSSDLHVRHLPCYLCGCVFPV